MKEKKEKAIIIFKEKFCIILGARLPYHETGGDFWHAHEEKGETETARRRFRFDSTFSSTPVKIVISITKKLEHELLWSSSHRYF